MDAGNILNTGNKFRGNAYGFKISSLKSFFSVTSLNYKNISLMEYLIEKMQKEFPEGLSFIDSFCEQSKVI